MTNQPIIKCPFCKYHFGADKLNIFEKSAFADGLSRQLTFVGVTCHRCGSFFGYNCNDRKPLEHNPQQLNTTDLQCPNRGCAGIVVLLDDEFGCGECGEIWKSERDLSDAILSIIAEFSYRRVCYEEKGGHLVSSGRLPESYDELVAQEGA